MLRNLESGETQRIGLPGALSYPYAWPTDDVVLYAAKVTKGEDPGFWRDPAWNHPYWLDTIKAGVINTMEFRTIVRHVFGGCRSFGSSSNAR